MKKISELNVTNILYITKFVILDAIKFLLKEGKRKNSKKISELNVTNILYITKFIILDTIKFLFKEKEKREKKSPILEFYES